MDVKKREKGISLYASLLISYVLILVIPLTLSIVCFHFAYQTIYNETALYQRTLLQQVQRSMDNMLESMISDVEIICANSNTNSLLQKNSYNGSDRFLIVNLKDDIKSIKDNKDTYANVGIIFYASQMIISDENVYAAPLMDTYMENAHLSSDFFERMTDTYGYFIEEREGTIYLTIYRTFYTANLKKSGASYISVNLNTIAAELKNLIVNQNSLYYIQTPDGDIINLTNFDSTLADIGYIEDPDSKVLLEYEDEIGTHYFRQVTASTVYPLNYGACIAKNSFLGNLYNYTIVILLETALALLTGIFLIRYFAKKNYLPVEKMQKFLEKNIGTEEFKKSKINYQSVSRALTKFADDQNSFKNLLRNSERQNENGKMAALLQGYIPLSEWAVSYLGKKEQLQNVSKYCAIVFAFDHLLENRFLQGDKTEKSYELLMFLVRNVIEDNLLGAPDETCHGISVKIENHIAVIFPMEEFIKGELIQKIESCLTFFEQSLSLNAIVGISSEYTKWEKLSIAYDEASIALEHKRFWENSVSNIIFYEDADSKIDEAVTFTPSEQSALRLRKVINNILANNTEASLKEMNDLCAQCFSKDVHMLRHNRLQAFMITGILWNTVYSSNESTAGDKKIGEYEKEIMNAQSLHELQAIICRMLEDTIEFKNQREQDNPEWIEKVMRFVKESYANPELNIAYIADNFEMPSAAMGQMFKKHTGESLIHYIHYIRIEHAKELLKEGKTLQECVDRIGFSDSKTFIRIFKQYEGITPGQYKQSLLRIRLCQ